MHIAVCEPSRDTNKAVPTGYLPWRWMAVSELFSSQFFNYFFVFAAFAVFEFNDDMYSYDIVGHITFFFFVALLPYDTHKH